VDRRTCTDVEAGGRATSLHTCALEQVAATGPAGDFLAIERPADDADPSDSFAEVQMYFHTTKAYAAFRQLVGDPDFTLDARPLTAIANFRLPLSECVDGVPPDGDELPPLDNAFFAPAGALPLFERDVIAFGQGTAIDFSYDGDVVYHELGHAFVFHQNDLGFATVDEAGIDPSPGGLHEGYADYLSSIITGDRLVGEYAGRALNPPLGAIRDLGNDLTCPRRLTGEPHEDSEPWSGALWQIREATAEGDRPALDRAVATALAGLGPDDGFGAAQELTAAEIEVALGPEAAAQARDVFRARGVDGCAGRVVDMAPGDRRELLVIGGGEDVPGPLRPAPLQFRVELARPARAIRIGLTPGNGNERLQLLVKPGDEPIRWTWSEAGGAHDAPIAGELDLTTGVTDVAGDFPAGVYHMQLVSDAKGAVVAEVGLAPAAAGEPDAGPGGDGGGDSDGEDGGDGGCGCRGARGGGGPGGALLLLVAALLAQRRRSASSSAAIASATRASSGASGPPSSASRR
jgi:MYXO-CTERM domain-containing protein